MNHLEIEKISKALADGTRLKLFEKISQNKRISCGELVSERGITPATVSHHLKILSDAGLIRCEREGQFVYSKTNPETLVRYSEHLTKIAGAKPKRRK